MNVAGKKLFAIGFALLLLVGIPVTVYLLQQQQETRSRAEKSTSFSFTPESSASSPIQKNVNDSIPLDIMVDPGKNLVSYVKLEIQYDPDKLATDSATPFQANSAIFPTVLEGPVYTPGKIAVTLAVGPDPTKALQTKVKAASISFKAIAPTGQGTPTLVTYSATSQALSTGPNDQASENVLSNTSPATIVIAGAVVPTTTEPTTAIPTDVPTAAPTTAVPTAAPTPTTAVPTSPPGEVGANDLPICESLSVDRETTGNAPYSLTFTANGSDSNGTINKVTFNFGDGTVEDVTDAGGIGTSSVNAQMSHTYNNPGTFQASAILTDDLNAVSNSASCQQTVTVNASGSASPTATNPTSAPSIAPTGSTEVLMGLGALAFILMVGGSLLFFVL